MRLYLDLNKAVSQMPNTSQEGVRSRQRSREYMTSFDTDYAGVNADASEDDPNVGSDWHAGDSTPVADLVNQKDEQNAESAADEKRIQGEEEEEEAASAAAAAGGGGGGDLGKALSVLDTLNKSLKEQLRLPSAQERKFLLEKGFDPKNVDLGFVKITGPLRHEFNLWLYRDLSKSVKGLLELTGVVDE